MLVVFVLTISILLSLSACGKEDSSKLGSSKDTSVEDSSVDKKTEKSNSNKWTIGDSKLAGGWTCVSVDNQGEFSPGILYGYDADLYIMYDGQCYGSLFESIYRLADSGSWMSTICSIDAKNGEFTFEDVSYNGEGTLDIKAEYTIRDIEKSSVSDRDVITLYHRNAKDDQLTIHFTGTNKVGPTDVKTVDFTLVYEKEGFVDSKNAGILWASMVGDWEDNYGNKWTFMTRTKAQDLGFVMKADGKEYEGQTDDYVAIGIDAYEVEGEIVYLMDISYKSEDLSDIRQAKVISYNGNELVLEQNDGQSLIFKR